MGDKGKVIGIGAPSSGFDSDRFEESVKFLESLGSKTFLDEGIFYRRDISPEAT